MHESIYNLARSTKSCYTALRGSALYTGTGNGANYHYNTVLAGGFDTNWDGHHDDGVVGAFPLSASALSGQKIH